MLPLRDDHRDVDDNRESCWLHVSENERLAIVEGRVPMRVRELAARQAYDVIEAGYRANAEKPIDQKSKKDHQARVGQTRAPRKDSVPRRSTGVESTLSAEKE